MKLPKVYEPNQYETDIYELWQQSGAFTPSKQGDPYSIVMPPPNANANLHIGYELAAVIEDALARYHRLQGKSVLLLPGADHAGFETQSVYEKHLAKEGKSRFDFTREELYKNIWDFVALNRGNFVNQMQRMGISSDWERFTFTLEDKIVQRAYATFKKMWDEGLIYRGERLVNFCTFHGTAFADIEVVHKEEQGHLWHIKYPLVDGSGEVTVATTRPETMLGDTAVAVHPDDDRYKHLVGKTVKLPLTHREIPILADEFVDKDFGTGAVKVTPAHDPNDFEVGKRHDLPMPTVIDHEGKLVNVPEAYRGLTVAEGRERIVKELEKDGALAETFDHVHNVGHCYKCDTVIQPLLRDQWFVDMQPLAKPAIKALKDKKIAFYPDAKREQSIRYLESLKDWNISRQIAWGIPIPAFQNVDDSDDWIYDERVDQEIIEVDGKTYRRDPDVFDTWFSSSSWPYATLDYPDGDDFKQFYPLAVMETGGEILYPWVCRMIMLGLYVTGKVPFKDVYIHGYVMAEDGSKMSKSIGNVVDPMPVIEQYGSDAMRMGILAGRVPAVNRGYDSRKVEDARNFCNKLWNVARYIEGVLGDDLERVTPKPETAADHWVLHKLQQVLTEVEADFANYRLAEAYDRLYHFVWDDVADWYIEASKSAQNKALLAHLLEGILIVLHPFAPFVTETIWQTLAWEKDSILATRPWPKVAKSNAGKAAEFDQTIAIVTEARAITKALHAPMSTLYHSGVDFLRDNGELIARLARLRGVTEVQDGDGLHLTTTTYDCWLDIDTGAARQYVQELERQQTELDQRKAQLQSRLDNKAYVKQAPKHLVSQTKEQLKDIEQQTEKLVAEAERFKQA